MCVCMCVKASSGAAMGYSANRTTVFMFMLLEQLHRRSLVPCGLAISSSAAAESFDAAALWQVWHSLGRRVLL